MQPSDEEVLGYEESEDEEDDVEDDVENADAAERNGNGSSAASVVDEEQEQDDLRDWGTSKADYYDADVLETEADALEEEAEARRLQQKYLKGMTISDFGFDEAQWAQDGAQAGDEGRGTVTEKLPEVEIPDEMPVADRLNLLKSRYPEFEPLAKDFVDLKTLHEDLRLAATATEAVLQHQSSARKRKLGQDHIKATKSATAIAVIKYRALSAYLGSIGMYFALLTSTSAPGLRQGLPLPPAELRDHPVIQSLLQCRNLWNRIKEIPLPEIEDLALDVEGQFVREDHFLTSDNPPRTNGEPVTKPKKQPKSKAEKAALAAQAAAEAQRAARIQETEARLADLSDLVAISSSLQKARTEIEPVKNGEADSDFGDEIALTVQEAAEKTQRKKSLRFYTSQIVQKSNKRGTASRDAGGDTDLPYKERLKDRQARLVQDAEKRGQAAARSGEKLDDIKSDDADEVQLAKGGRGDGSGEDEYYDMVAANSKQKKADKKALVEARAEAAKQGGQVYVEEEVSPDGKRAITYAIAKNKGLAPKRKKDVRNPRVKKRKKYDEKKKKLSSIRQVFTGGEGRGGYGGELTGIKKNLVKSVKL